MLDGFLESPTYSTTMHITYNYVAVKQRVISKPCRSTAFPNVASVSLPRTSMGILVRLVNENPHMSNDWARYLDTENFLHRKISILRAILGQMIAGLQLLSDLVHFCAEGERAIREND
jgi:hypothetical protein